MAVEGSATRRDSSTGRGRRLSSLARTGRACGPRRRFPTKWVGHDSWPLARTGPSQFAATPAAWSSRHLSPRSASSFAPANASRGERNEELRNPQLLLLLFPLGYFALVVGREGLARAQGLDLQS